MPKDSRFQETVTAWSVPSADECRLSACCGCGKIKLQFGPVSVSMKRSDFLVLVEQWYTMAEQGTVPMYHATVPPAPAAFAGPVLEFAASP
jgi:hypothetical protein